MSATELWKDVGDGQWVGSDPSQRFPVYTRGNAGEVYPEVFTPLSFSLAAEAGERAMRNALLDSGLIQPKELEGIPLTTAVGSGVFGGYAYLNLSIQRLASARVPGGKATDADVNYLGVGDPPPHLPRKGDRSIRAGLAGLRFIWRTINDPSLPQLAVDQKRVEDYLARLPERETATDDELRRAATTELIPLFADLFETHLKVSFAAGLTVSVVTILCERLLDDSDLAVQLLVGLGDVDSAAPSVALWDLGRRVAADDDLTVQFDRGLDGLLERLEADAASGGFVARFEAFLAEFGSRGPNEWDTAFDTWETDPSLALALIDRLRLADESHAPARQQKRLHQEQLDLRTETTARIPRPVRGIFAKAVQAARSYSQSRERTKTTVVRAIHGGRLLAQELDRRLYQRSGGDRGDLWFVVDDEMDHYLAEPEAFAGVITERRRLHHELDRRNPPFFFSGQQPPLDTWQLKTAPARPVEVGEVLPGLPGCMGVQRGRARVVTDPADPRGLEPGDVLIAPLTDPSWTPLFIPAEAVVVDVGAVMSHAVIVSRELGIPCVVSVTDASKRIPDGAMIEVDGTNGTVTVIDL